MTPSVSSNGPPLATENGKELTASGADRCTAGCTSEARTANAGTVEALAAVLMGLSLEDRARLMALVMNAPAAGPPADFDHRFALAFDRLDRAAGGHNFVSLVELRKALPDIGCDAFDRGFRALRIAGKYTPSAAEGRFGVATEERQAGIMEEGTLLLFVSRQP